MTPEHRKILADAWANQTQVVVTMKDGKEYTGLPSDLCAHNFRIGLRWFQFDGPPITSISPAPAPPPKSRERELAEKTFNESATGKWMRDWRFNGVQFGVHEIRPLRFREMINSLTALLEQHRREVLEEARKGLAAGGYQYSGVIIDKMEEAKKGEGGHCAPPSERGCARPGFFGKAQENHATERTD